MKKVSLFVFFTFSLVLLAACTPSNGCTIVESTGNDAQAYEGFIDSLPDGFNLNFEVLALKTAVMSYNTSGNQGCPATFSDLQGAEKVVTTEDGEFELVYEKLNDKEARIGVKDSEGKIYYYAF